MDPLKLLHQLAALLGHKAVPISTPARPAATPAVPLVRAAVSDADAWTNIASYPSIPGTNGATQTNVSLAQAFPNGFQDFADALAQVRAGTIGTYGAAHLYPAAAAVALVAVNANPARTANDLLVNGPLWEGDDGSDSHIQTISDMVLYMSALNFYVGIFYSQRSTGPAA